MRLQKKMISMYGVDYYYTFDVDTLRMSFYYKSDDSEPFYCPWVSTYNKYQKTVNQIIAAGGTNENKYFNIDSSFGTVLKSLGYLKKSKNRLLWVGPKNVDDVLMSNILLYKYLGKGFGTDETGQVNEILVNTNEASENVITEDIIANIGSFNVGVNHEVNPKNLNDILPQILNIKTESDAKLVKDMLDFVCFKNGWSLLNPVV